MNWEHRIAMGFGGAKPALPEQRPTWHDPGADDVADTSLERLFRRLAALLRRRR